MFLPVVKSLFKKIKNIVTQKLVETKIYGMRENPIQCLGYVLPNKVAALNQIISNCFEYKVIKTQSENMYK